MPITNSEEIEFVQRAKWTFGAQPVFLVGCSRSGTTWLQAMLADNPDIVTGPETYFFLKFLGAFRAHQSEYWKSESFYRAMESLYWFFLSSLPEPETQPKYFLDKSPNHYHASEFILKTFPEARFIHLIRDGRAVVASLLRARKTWAKGKQWWDELSVEEACNTWISAIRGGRAIRSSMPSPHRYFELKYEQLRNDPVPTMSRLFEWLEVPLSFSVESIVKRNSLQQIRNSSSKFASIRSPLANADLDPYPEGFIGPAPVGPEAIELTRLQRLRVERLLGPLLRELDYPDVKELSLIERIRVSVRFRRLLRLPPL